MNKKELIAKISEKSGLTKKDSEKALNAIIESITETLTKKEKIQLIGFGSFEVRERKARKGRNPRNPKEVIEIPAQNAIVFKAGSNLKKAVNK